MVVFELPSLPPGAGARVASLGSCRVHGPLAALADRGKVRYSAFKPIFFTHTAAEALQTLELVAGDATLPAALSPFVFGTKAPPPMEPFRSAMGDGPKAILVEVSHDRQFVHDDIRLQASYLSGHLVRPHGPALLSWFRELCRGEGSVDEACVQAAAEALRRSGFEVDDFTIDLLRHVRMERHDGDAIAKALETIRSRVDGRLVVIGHIDVQARAGAIMEDRRALNTTLRRAAARCGAVFHDPSRLVAEFGGANALGGGGADVYEYAPDFRVRVGESLIALADGERSTRRRPSSPDNADGPSGGAETGFSARSSLAERLNVELVDLHRSRLASMGPEASGLYDYYEALIGRFPLVGSRERAVLELVDAYLPAYASYGVMRAGLGEAALLLAASGRRVIAYELNANRRSAIEEGFRHLQSVGLMGQGSMTLMASLDPEAEFGGPALGVALNLGLPQGDPGAADLEKMAAFDALLVDPGFFFRGPSDRQDTQPVEERLARIGFDARRYYPADSLVWFHR